jgi:hypothetical protein
MNRGSQLPHPHTLARLACSHPVLAKITRPRTQRHFSALLNEEDYGRFVKRSEKVFIIMFLLYHDGY